MQYREMQVMSATPARLTVMLFEHLEVLLRRAMMAIETEQVATRVESLSKARAILSEFLGTLNLEEGGDIAVELSQLYSYLLSELVDVGIRRDAVLLGRLIGIVVTLREGFTGAAAIVDHPGSLRPIAVSA